MKYEIYQRCCKESFFIVSFDISGGDTNEYIELYKRIVNLNGEDENKYDSKIINYKLQNSTYYIRNCCDEQQLVRNLREVHTGSLLVIPITQMNMPSLSFTKDIDEKISKFFMKGNLLDVLQE